MNKRRIRNVSAIVCFTMLFTMFGFTAGIKEAAAAVTRVAIVTEIEGTVKVKKSGGTKQFNAFKSMSLNEGDMITTSKGASVVLELADTKAEKDEITVGENSQINFTKLEDKNGKKAKMNVWAGSLWVKVKSISNADDTFEVETPTAIMGVRGTNFWQAVDPITGRTSVVVASGVVRASTVTSTENEETKKSLQESKYVNVYPAQQIVLDSSTRSDDLVAKVEVVDVNELVQQAPPSIIERIIQSAADIQQENEGLKEKLRSDLNNGSPVKDPKAGLVVNNLADLDKVMANLDNIVGNVAKQAVDAKKLEKEHVDRIVRDANQAIADPAKKIDLSNVKPIDPNAGLDPALEAERQRAKAAAEAAEKRKAEEQRLLLEAQQRLAALMAQIEADRKALDEANRKTAEDAAKKAADQLKAQLDAAARAALEQRVAQAQQQQQQQQQQPTTNPGTGTGTTSPGVSIPAPSGVSTASPQTLIDVKLDGFSSNNAIFGYQVEVEFDDRYFAFNETDFGKHENGKFNEFRNLASSPFKVELADGWQPPANYAINAVDTFFVKKQDDNDTLSYVVLKYTGNAEPVTNQSVVKLPFKLTNNPAASGPVAFKVKITPVNANGDVIAGLSSTVNVQVTV